MSTPTGPFLPIIWGFDKNFFTNLTPTASGAGTFNTNCDVVITFPTQTVTFMCTGTNAAVQYSFNGNTIHGDMSTAGPNNVLIFENRPICKIWFTTVGGSPNIRIEAWATR